MLRRCGKLKTLVTNKEIEEVGEGLIHRYSKKSGRKINSIDIEGFIRECLHLPIAYVSMAEDDKDKIGFVSDGKYSLKVWENGEKVGKVFPKGTIIIDRYLLNSDQTGRRRFTLAHEAAHVIFERMSPIAVGPCFNRIYDKERDYSVEELRSHLSLCEMQTDRLASVLLMPKFLIEHTLQRFNRGKPIPIYGCSILGRKDKLTIQKMAESLDVTFTALMIRLRELKLFEPRDMSEYFDKELELGV